MIFLIKNNRNKLIVIYTFLLFALTILIGFLSIPIYTSNQNIDYSQLYIADQNYLGNIYSSAIENNERNFNNLRLLLRNFVFLFIFISMLKSPQKLVRGIKTDFNSVVLFRKLKRILIMKQNTDKYKSSLYINPIRINIKLIIL